MQSYLFFLVTHITVFSHHLKGNTFYFKSHPGVQQKQTNKKKEKKHYAPIRNTAVPAYLKVAKLILVTSASLTQAILLVGQMFTELTAVTSK